MRRRDFMMLIGGAAVAWPLAVRAQQPGKLPTIGFLASGTPSSHTRWVTTFVQRLSELGWIEGRTVAIEVRWAEGRSDHAAEIAADFVRLKVDVVVTTGPLRHSQQSRRQRSSRSSSWLRRTRLPATSSQALRDRAATSPACRTRKETLPASASNSYARFFPVSADWRSWSMSVILPP
jgi:hypothetical protein